MFDNFSTPTYIALVKGKEKDDSFEEKEKNNGNCSYEIIKNNDITTFTPSLNQVAGIFEADSVSSAIKKAAAFYGVDKKLVKAYRVLNIAKH